MNKRGVNLILGNVVFIILNVVFIAILIIFIFSRLGNASVYEEQYSKQIALALDSARPGMIITVNMQKAFDKAKKNFGTDDMNQTVIINDNLVTVKLQDGKGYTYSFFNKINILKYYPNVEGTGFIFYIGDYNE